MNYQNEKFFIEFNPLGIANTGQFNVKVDNDAQSPFAIVILGSGIKDAKERGKAKADYILECLNDRGTTALDFAEWLMQNCDLSEDRSLYSYEGEDYTNEKLLEIFLNQRNDES